MIVKNIIIFFLNLLWYGFCYKLNIFIKLLQICSENRIKPSETALDSSSSMQKTRLKPSFFLFFLVILHLN